MLPTGIVGIRNHSWKPLGKEENVAVVVFEMLVSTAPANSRLLNYVESPAYVEHNFALGLQCLFKVNAHHGVYHHEG